MAAGRWVFPIAILGFFVFLVAWVAQNPATPLPGGGGADRLLRAEPGDVLLLTCEIETVRGPIGRGRAEARVGDEVAARGRLTFAVER